MNCPSPTTPDFSQPSGVVQVGSLEGLIPGLVHGFSGALPQSAQSPFGPLVSGWLIELFGPDVPPLMVLDQIHSSRVMVWRPEPHHKTGPLDGPLPKADGVLVLAGERGLAAIRTADCVPVLAADPQTGGVAALHAGWRGVAMSILPNLLAQWAGQGSRLDQVRLVLGPSIRQCCFEVQPDCLALFAPPWLEGTVEIRRNSAGQISTFLDLTQILIRQAGAFGVDADRIELVPFCTRCHMDPDGSHPFASYRRAVQSGEKSTDFNASFIGITR
ncbi:MAG: polyphenol oxidase family protein [Deltaproteobacteria bacterium]|nr:polyphenol oxidase family protein [Deltaproteobacteria bacterium]